MATTTNDLTSVTDPLGHVTTSITMRSIVCARSSTSGVRLRATSTAQCACGNRWLSRVLSPRCESVFTLDGLKSTGRGASISAEDNISIGKRLVRSANNRRGVVAISPAMRRTARPR